MPNAAHEALVQRWMERIDEAGIFAALAEIAAPDVQLENPGTTSDLSGLVVRFGEIASAFPDAQASVEELISDGDRLVLVLEVRATHLGRLRTIEPTGRPVQFNVAFVIELDGVRVRRLRTYPEFFSVMEQIGFFPPVGASPEPVVEAGGDDAA
jgi:predicted ester cyclase